MSKQEIKELQDAGKGTDEEFNIFVLDQNGDYRLDFSLLNRYILPRLKIKTIKDDQITFVTRSFRQCEIRDFTRVGYHPDVKNYENYKSRFCPDLNE